MPRFTAFLRGVSPVNARMPELKSCFEAAGFGNVRTVLGSGNVVFDSDELDQSVLERSAQDAMARDVGHGFYTIVRSCAELQACLVEDPYAEHGIPLEAKRVVSFFRTTPVPKVALPLAEDSASVFLLWGREVYSAYLPTDKGPVFMKLIERAFGKDVTTRTLDTVRRCASA